MTKSEYFTLAAKKNALRREAGLPLVDMREEIARQEYADAITNYNHGAELHRADRNRIFEEVLQEERAKRGGDLNSSGGRFIVARITTQRFRDFLAERGFKYPAVAGKTIEYGKDKKKN